MSSNIIFPSAGHHLTDPGAIYNGRQENKEMIAFRDLVIKRLDALGHATIRDGDHETAAAYQARIKTGSGSVVCEFHLNASANLNASGTEAVVADNPAPNSRAMAKELMEVTASVLGIRNRGVLPESRTPRKKIGIVNKKGTAVLLEICFLSNTNDMAAFDANKEKLAAGYADILIKYDKML